MSKKTTRPMTPSVYYIDDEGKTKFIHGRFELQTIVNAIYKDLSTVGVGKHTVTIEEQLKTDEEWKVKVSNPFGYEA